MRTTGYALLLLLCTLQACRALYAPSGPVELLTADTFARQVEEGGGVWMVEFYAPWCGHCKTLAPEWEKAAGALKGVVGVAAVDATQEGDLAAKFSVQGYPTILTFAADKASPHKYEGARTADAIVAAGLKSAEALVNQRLKGKPSGDSSKKGTASEDGKSGGSDGGSSDVVELTEDTFDDLVIDSNDPWLVEFFAPWCGHCKNLAPEWAKAATTLKGSMKMGAVDATVHPALAQRFDVSGYPTIKFFAPGSKDEPMEYDGGRVEAGIVDWSFKKLEEYGIGPAVAELISEDVMREACLSKRICVVAVLPHVLDTGAEGRQKYINVVVENAKKFRGKPLGFVWAEGGQQTKFEETFGISFNYPTLIAISEAKLRYQAHRGAFDEKSTVKFLQNVFAGRVQTVPFKGMPALRTTEPWDGQGYVPPAEDDEE